MGCISVLFYLLTYLLTGYKFNKLNLNLRLKYQQTVNMHITLFNSPASALCHSVCPADGYESEDQRRPRKGLYLRFALLLLPERLSQSELD